MVVSRCYQKVHCTFAVAVTDNTFGFKDTSIDECFDSRSLFGKGDFSWFVLESLVS